MRKVVISRTVVTMHQAHGDLTHMVTLSVDNFPIGLLCAFLFVWELGGFHPT